MKKGSKEGVGLTIAVLLLSCVVIGVGGLVPKKDIKKVSLCEIERGEEVIVSGIVLSASLDNTGRKYTSIIKEGSQGCEVVVSSRKREVGLLREPGARVRFRGRGIEGSFVENLGGVERDAGVVDTSGRVEEGQKIRINLYKKPKLYGSEKSATLVINRGDGEYLSLSIPESILNEMRENKINLLFYDSTNQVKSVKVE